MKWQPLSKTPPNKLLKVRDELYREHLAYPTYYPFKVVPDTLVFKWDLVHCDEYWDGGWLIQADFRDLKLGSSRIKQWKEV